MVPVVSWRLGTALSMLAVLAGVELGAIASFALLGVLQPAVVVVATGLCVAGVVRALTAGTAHAGRSAAGWLGRTAVLFAACLGLAASLHDFSHDGQQYHQQAILALAQGWNPLGPAEYLGPHALWVNSYTKGVWLYAAALESLGLGVEAGKSFNLLAALAAGLLCADLLIEPFGLRRRWAWAVAGVMAFNPVFASQWPTYYNDNVVGSLLLALGVSSVAWLRAPAERWKAQAMALGLSLFLVANVKSSGLAYAMLVMVALVIALARVRSVARLKRVVAAAGVGLLLAVATVGFNPYVTNTLRHGHPLYPLRGGHADIISGNASAEFLARSRVEQLLLSVFSRSRSIVESEQRGAADQFQLKVPGAIDAAELEVFFSKTDTRIGGFGPWFSLTVVAALLTAALLVLRGRLSWREAAGLAALPAVLLAMALMFPQPWWARYVPQLWLLPPAIAAAAWLLRPGDTLVRRSATVVLALALVNSALVAALFAARSVTREMDFQTQAAALRRIAEADGPIPVAADSTPSSLYRLRSLGVAVRERQPADRCDLTPVVVYAHAALCLREDQRARYREESPTLLAMKGWVQRGRAR